MSKIITRQKAIAAKHGKRYRFVPDDVIAWAKENLNNNTTGKEVEA
jgi:hypothetical protein